MSTPAVEVRSFAAVIPAGTTADAPVTVDVSFPPRVVTAIRWRVPPGPAGLMGWRLTMSGGVAVIPVGGGWIIANDETETWPLTDQPDSGSWEVTGYNTGGYDHAVYLDFLLDLVGTAAAAPDLVPNADLSSPVPVTAPAPVSIPAVSVPGA